MQDESLENMIVALHCRGWAMRELSREFNVSRGRVRRILARWSHKRETGKELPRKAIARASKLDAYKDYITELLDAYKDPPVTVQRVFEMIRDKGYDGGRTIVSCYLAGIRGKQAGEPVVCVETTSGQRGSHDWSEYSIYFTETGRKEKVTFFSFILNYSRRQYIEVAQDKTQATLFQCLVNTFIYMDGVPRQVKSDNQKACVDRWEFGKAVFNRKFLDFATWYRFEPLAITPGKPRENLKVERPFYYLEKSFLNARSFQNKQDLKMQLLDWLQSINDQRVHRTTGETPVSLYQKEYPYLQPLPLQHYDTALAAYRVVNNESCIQWQGFFYVVPAQYMNQPCLVRQSDDQVTICSPDGSQIVCYPLAAKENGNKYVGRHAPQQWEASSPKTEEVISRLESMGPVMQQYIAHVKMYKEGSYRHHLRRILSLKVSYQTEDILVAVGRALKFKVYESSAIENFLRVNAEQKNGITLFPKTRPPYED
jgi:transposase